jgi:hypothetical protein
MLGGEPRICCCNAMGEARQDRSRRCLPERAKAEAPRPGAVADRFRGTSSSLELPWRLVCLKGNPYLHAEWRTYLHDDMLGQ